MPKKRTVEAAVKEIVAEHFMTDEHAVTPGTRFRQDLDADSLDIIELAMLLEEAFDIETSDEDADRLTTVEAAVKLVEEKMAALKIAIVDQLPAVADA